MFIRVNTSKLTNPWQYAALLIVKELEIGKTLQLVHLQYNVHVLVEDSCCTSLCIAGNRNNRSSVFSCLATRSLGDRIFASFLLITQTELLTQKSSQNPSQVHDALSYRWASWLNGCRFRLVSGSSRYEFRPISRLYLTASSRIIIFSTHCSLPFHSPL